MVIVHLTTMVATTVLWNQNTTYALGLYRLITGYLGIWPLNYGNLIQKCQVAVIYVLQLAMMLSMLGETYLSCGAVSDRILTISLISCAGMAIFKVFIVRLNNTKLLRIILAAFDDWTTATNGTKKMRQYAKLGRFVCLFQMIGAYVTLIPMILIGLAALGSSNMINSTDQPVRLLPLNTLCFYGDMSTGVYIAVYLLQVIQLITTCNGNVGCDCYFFGLAMYLCGKVELLMSDFEAFGSASSCSECREEFGRLIRKQNNLMGLIDDLERTFSIIILAQLTAVTYQVCLAALDFVVNIRGGNTVVVINNMVMLIVLHIQLLLYCYAGEQLSLGVENLGLAIYNCQWCDLPIGITKDLVLVLMRSHKSFRLTAGGVMVMNLESFKNIVKGVGSYISVLLAMFDE